MVASVSASTGKSTYTCDSCKKLTGDTEIEHSIAKCNQEEELSTEIQCPTSSIGDNASLSMQLEAVCANGVCTMEMVQSLIVMVTKLSSEVHLLRIDDTLKKQLHDLQQAPLMYHLHDVRLYHLP
jgi:hypothetical protein